MNANKQQVKAINATLASKGMMEEKKALISSFTNGRTDRCSSLTSQEAIELIQLLNRDFVPSNEDLRKEKMARKILAMAHELGWIKKEQVITSVGMEEKRNYKSFNEWMTKFSYLKKPLSQYTYTELPKLVSQFEDGPYFSYISKL